MTSVFNASRLLSQADVLNGVAFYLARDTFFITDKLWLMLFEVHHRSDAAPFIRALQSVGRLRT